MTTVGLGRIRAVERALTAGRFGTYLTHLGGRDYPGALSLYEWNAKISSAFILPLHICEVSVRNAAAEAIESVYGPRWPWSSGFERSLPTPVRGYNPKNDLINSRRGCTTAGKVIPELKFAFWNDLFTSRHDQRLWNPHFRTCFPNAPKAASTARLRAAIYDHLSAIRKFRNRVAHHEPIFRAPLGNDYSRLTLLVRWRCCETSAWLTGLQGVTGLLTFRS